MVLRQRTAGLIRGVGLELCDRAGNVLASAAGDQRVVVSDPGGQTVLVLEGRGSPVRVLDPGGGLLGVLEQSSRRFATPSIAISGPHGEPVGRLSGPHGEMRLSDSSGALIADVLMEGGAQVLVLREDPAEPLRSLVVASLIAANRLVGSVRGPWRSRTATGGMPAGEFRLHDTRAALVRPAAVFTGIGIIGAAAGFSSSPFWYILGAAGIALGAMFAVIAIRYPLVVTLSGAGLTARGHDGDGVLPASAIEQVGVAKVGRVHYVTLWYDTAAVPSLPPAFGRYLRSQPQAGSGRIHVGVIGESDGAARTSELYRLVQETGLGEWRDH
jgi:hypothetical protein